MVAAAWRPGSFSLAPREPALRALNPGYRRSGDGSEPKRLALRRRQAAKAGRSLSLHLVATLLPEKRHLGVGLDPLREHRHPKPWARPITARTMASDRPLCPSEATKDRFNVRQGGIAGTEVVWAD